MVDTDTAAVVGHSYGGYTALVAGGARLDTAGFEHRCATVSGTDQPGAFLCDTLAPHLTDMAALADLPEVPDGLWPDWSAPTVDAVVSLAGDAYLFDDAGLEELDVPSWRSAARPTPTPPTTCGAPNRPSPTPGLHTGHGPTLDGAGHMVFTARCTTVRRI